ncbi:CdaR family protein [Polaribacter sp. P097]|uniref:CdaR family protein n=1 Tax=Polaribacter sp. P097 TaxID=3117398 RepID=UPI002FE2455F
MKTSKKIPKTFFVFVVISFFIWLLITFSKEYVTEVTLPVQYSNIPQNKLLQKAPIKELNLSIKATGFKIAITELRKKMITIDASKLQQKKVNQYYILTRNQFLNIQKQLMNGVDLQEIEKDTINLNIDELASKYVALKPNLELEYHIGYDLLNEVSIQPDSILISGPSSQIESISQLELENLILTDIKSDFSHELSILKPKDLENIKLTTSTVTINGSVDKFTEGTINVPFTINNLPDNVNVTILNEEIQIVFVVALSNFNEVSKSSFKVECDYEMSANNDLSYLIPKITLKPSFVRSVKLYPSKIDFLIQK